MSNPYVGEIRLFGGNFAPVGWAFCNGQLLAIAEQEALFNLIGTTYGGDGQQTFALPDLRGRVPVHAGAGPGLGNRFIGESGGSESVTLIGAQMGAHSHLLGASTSAATASAGPSGVLAASTTSFYGTGAPATKMAAGAISAVGGGQPHDNMAPFQAINYIISLFGIFPSQN